MTKTQAHPPLPEMSQQWPGVWTVEYRGHNYRVEARRGPLDVRWAVFRDETFIGTATSTENARANILAFHED